ncbi:alpha-amylase family glycosyl hydrolase, partial [Salmonella enterica subsp. enterica serovar Typhimurium]|nr:alpha-amylase family glycosyl hydrolase [Salmonella enterica subsp. enterica serovar Typhimurium]
MVYLVMIDRFADGDPRNNDQGTGEFDPASEAKFSGGDLPGIAQRLDYIEGLGATALWITPPVLNQW